MFSSGKKKKKPIISQPSNFEHRVHTGFDPRAGSYVGLPPQWASIVDRESSRHRPMPIIDPSTITPTEISDLKVIVRGPSTAELRSPRGHHMNGFEAPRGISVARSNSLRQNSPPRVRRMDMGDRVPDVVRENDYQQRPISYHGQQHSPHSPTSPHPQYNDQWQQREPPRDGSLRRDRMQRDYRDVPPDDRDFYRERQHMDSQRDYMQPPYPPQRDGDYRGGTLPHQRDPAYRQQQQQPPPQHDYRSPQERVDPRQQQPSYREPDYRTQPPPQRNQSQQQYRDPNYRQYGTMPREQDGRHPPPREQNYQQPPPPKKKKVPTATLR